MKPGRPVVLGSQPHPDAKRVLCRRAKELRCRWKRPAGGCVFAVALHIRPRSMACAARLAWHFLWQYWWLAWSAVTHLSLRRRIYDSQAEVWPRQLIMEQDSVWQECSVFLLNGECGDAAGRP